MPIEPAEIDEGLKLIEGILGNRDASEAMLDELRSIPPAKLQILETLDLTNPSPRTQRIIDMMGARLESKGLTEESGGHYLQTDNNCYQVAAQVAHDFGYELSPDPAVHEQLWRQVKMSANGWAPPLPSASPVRLLFREPDELEMFRHPVHVTTSVLGLEFNYGVTAREGFYYGGFAYPLRPIIS